MDGLRSKEQGGAGTCRELEGEPALPWNITFRPLDDRGMDPLEDVKGPERTRRPAPVNVARPSISEEGVEF